MIPYYQDDLVTIYHGDCREWMPNKIADAIIADPPYGSNKAKWDNNFSLEWMTLASEVSSVLALQPGIWNLLHCPVKIGRLQYRWTLAAHLINGMSRSTVGFGNWIPTLLYAADGISLHQLDTDIKRFTVMNSDFPKHKRIRPGEKAIEIDHPTPKPLSVIKWIISRLPGDLVLDPFMGSGTSLVAAKFLGRHSIGIEIEERYCEIAANRCRQDVLGI